MPPKELEANVKQPMISETRPVQKLPIYWPGLSDLDGQSFSNKVDCESAVGRWHLWAVVRDGNLKALEKDSASTTYYFNISGSCRNHGSSVKADVGYQNINLSKRQNSIFQVLRKESYLPKILHS